MKQYKMEIEHFGSCPVCLRSFSLHQKYEADTGHVYGEIEMFCPADDSDIILDLEKVHIERIANRTHGSIEDLMGLPTIQISTHEKEPKKSPATVTQLIPKNADSENFLNVGQVAELLKVCHATLYLWRKRNRGPKFSKSSFGIVGYRRSDVDDFMKTNPEGYTHLRGERNGDS